MEAWRTAEFYRCGKLATQKLLMAVFPEVCDAGVRHIDERFIITSKCGSYIKDADTIGSYREPVAPTRQELAAKCRAPYLAFGYVEYCANPFWNGTDHLRFFDRHVVRK